MKDAGLVGIGLKLKGIRKDRGLTQQQVATKASIFRQDVSRIENGSFVGALNTCCLQAYNLPAKHSPASLFSLMT